MPRRTVAIAAVLVDGDGAAVAAGRAAELDRTGADLAEPAAAADALRHDAVRQCPGRRDAAGSSVDGDRRAGAAAATRDPSVIVPVNTLDAEDAAAATPPPPLTLCASSPTDCSPVVKIAALLVTETVPPVPLPPV